MLKKEIADQGFTEEHGDVPVWYTWPCVKETFEKVPAAIYWVSNYVYVVIKRITCEFACNHCS